MISLSAVPTRSSVCNRRVATNISAGGMINLRGRAAINRPRSSVNAAISITACSSEVSFKSAFVDGLFEFVPPSTVGWFVANKNDPSPDLNVSKPVFNNEAAFVCFVYAIARASALV